MVVTINLCPQRSLGSGVTVVVSTTSVPCNDVEAVRSNANSRLARADTELSLVISLIVLVEFRDVS